MIGYGWGNVCYVVIFSPGEYLQYSKVFGGNVYYIANIPRVVNIPGEGLLYDTGAKHFSSNHFFDVIYSLLEICFSIKIKILLPQAYVILADFGYPA